ncbi:MAG TPA: saccharopine dehydrogenase NADP-binding domain-containing protein [Rhodoferax sp.]|nr:saccharopine dehydrogenase NADP-binding domain-containing protein [Rhodoferax sp.]
MSRLLIYGANGYSGRLIVDAAVKRGMKPIVAGRSAKQLASLGKELGLEHRSFDLADPAAVKNGLAGIKVVLHCAGPFSATALPMLAACIAQRVHYLDITGEFHVMEDVAARDADLRAAGVMAMCGVGMDVVPSDCLAAHMKRRMPGAIRLELFVRALERLSRGTATSFVENMGLPNVVRENGALVERVAGLDRRKMEFSGDKQVSMVSLPWGDISTAWRTTGIPNIKVYMSLMPGAAQMIRFTGRFRDLFQSAGMQGFFKRQAQRWISGPSQTYRDKQTAEFVAIASDAAGNTCRSHLVTKEGYAFTADSASEIAQRVLDGAAQPGFQTPGGFFGPDFVLEFDGSRRQDIN